MMDSVRGIAVRCRGFFTPRLGRLRQYPPRPLRLAHRAPKQRAGSMPLISIVTPSLNQGQFLERTIQSVLQQKYPRLEYIVQDGGSDDGTLAILQRNNDELHFWESKPDRGQADAVNRGFRRSSGEILAWLNADDLLLPGALDAVAGFFRRRPAVDVVYGQRIIIDEEDRETGRWILPPHENAAFLWKDFVPQETLFWRKRIWERTGAALDTELHFALDWDLLFRFHRAGAKFARLPRFLGAFRVHEGQKTTALLEKTGFEEMSRVLARYHGRAVPTSEIDRRLGRYLTAHLFYSGMMELGLARR